MTLAGFLIAMVGPLTARVLAALGLSLVSVAGLAAGVAALKAMVLDNVGGLPLAGAQLLGLYGAWEALGLIFATMAVIVTWRATTGWKLARLAT